MYQKQESLQNCNIKNAEQKISSPLLPKDITKKE
jgi:hypothetical protein